MTNLPRIPRPRMSFCGEKRACHKTLFFDKLSRYRGRAGLAADGRSLHTIMKWLYKLEYKYGRFCIPNLMLYIVIGQAFVYLADMFTYGAFSGFLTLYWPGVLQGQVWRLLTFIFVPQSGSMLSLLISLYFYYFIGSTLENAWGSFKFNVYYLCGILGAILAAIITGMGFNMYLNLSLFFAFAVLFPDMQVLLFFIIPIKVKYMALFSGALYLFYIIIGSWAVRASIVASLLNFFLFFGGNFINTVKQELRYRKTRNAWRNQNQNKW